jgi:plasmid maintenance system antidote protein VapI
MKKNPENIEDQLRAAIEGSGLTVNAIANAAGVQQSTLFRFVTGATSIQMRSAAKVAALFGMSLTKPRKVTRAAKS